MRRFFLGLALALALCLALAGCAPSREAADVVRVTLDGEAFDGGPVDPGAEDDFRVYVTLDGAPLLDLPFSKPHTVAVLQPDGSENVIDLTGDAVYMRSANCENHDCVDMGAVTRDNLEARVMGGFIICLPHRLSVEVRGE